MNKETNAGISFFQRYLTVWVFLCMVAGVLLGWLAPAVPAALDRFTYARVSIPMAILIWVMIYPMMLKVDFQSVRNVGKNPKGLFVTWATNWLIKPFSMYGIHRFRCSETDGADVPGPHAPLQDHRRPKADRELQQ